MKEEKVCINKTIALLAAVTVLILGVVVFTNYVSTTKTSTDTRAAGAYCGPEGVLTTQKCSDYMASVDPTGVAQGKYKITESLTYPTGSKHCCIVTKADSFDCAPLINTFAAAQRDANQRIYSCTYYTGSSRPGVTYMGTAANDCAVKVVNDYLCGGENVRLTPAADVTPYTTPGSIGSLDSQKKYCEDMAGKVAELTTHKDYLGALQTTGCTYYKTPGSVRNSGIFSTTNCKVDVTNDSSRCGAVGTVLAAAGACSTKRCYTGDLANETCLGVAGQTGYKCHCDDRAETTEIPTVETCVVPTAVPPATPTP